LYRGDTYSWSFRLWDDEDQTVPHDLTGATAAAQIRNKPAGDLVIDLDCAVVTTGPPGPVTTNTVQVELPADRWTAAPGIGVGAWDLEITYPDGNVTTVLAGKVTVTLDVTNSTPAPVALNGARLRSA
jgi:hypothetical protein